MEIQRVFIENDELNIVLKDSVPNCESMVFRSKTVDGRILFWANEGGYVKFLSYNSKNETGYGGSVYTLQLEDGSTTTIRGPWSSRASYMNIHFPHCIEVVLHQGGCRMHGHITVPKAELLLPDNYHIYQDQDEEILYLIRR